MPPQDLIRTITDRFVSKKTDIPVYAFEKHARQEHSNTIYSPHVLILEGIFALHDQRVLDLLDLKIFADAEGDLCLSRRREFAQSILSTRSLLMQSASKSCATYVNVAGTSKGASSSGSASSSRTSTATLNLNGISQVCDLFRPSISITILLMSNNKKA